MDWALIFAVTIPFGLTATALWVAYPISQKGKGEKREVGYLREAIQIDAAAVPEFKPTWQDMRVKGEASETCSVFPKRGGSAGN